ncbi:hypothetical protein RhiirC2_778639 [Rhizophagus irregularis]|uniref:Uncharacterized protein n=1 Tax=Rhizophagus irregularis TaxID=588596 RepID=A0A2N1NBH2_9GLOM|nr:hypothetical protein RhiirC2_778639 [Rhizophagus irregularis]
MTLSETIDIDEPTTQLGKRKALRSELFVKNLFEEKELPPEHKDAKSHREVTCLSCL